MAAPGRLAEGHRVTLRDLHSARGRLFRLLVGSVRWLCVVDNLAYLTTRGQTTIPAILTTAYCTCSCTRGARPCQYQQIFPAGQWRAVWAEQLRNSQPGRLRTVSFQRL